jgi:biopolymer transport protein ExbD
MGKFHTPPSEESVACNLIPMIDIMFLLLLFFMLGADMTQHELADVVLPKADKCKEDERDAAKGGGHRSTVNIYHRRPSAAFTCAAFEAHQVCRDMSHWLIDIRGKEYDRESLKIQLKTEASLEMEPPAEPGAPPLSGRRIMIRADHLAPFGFIQRVIETCAAAGIYKIEVGAARPAPTP